MLKGLHEGKEQEKKTFTIEKMNHCYLNPLDFPTGLYGLIDLIGLDVMYSVGKNLELNLPENDLENPM